MNENLEHKFLKKFELYYIIITKLNALITIRSHYTNEIGSSPFNILFAQLLLIIASLSKLKRDNLFPTVGLRFYSESWQFEHRVQFGVPCPVGRFTCSRSCAHVGPESV